MKPEEKLADWSAAWVRDGVVTASQRETILARHPVPTGSANRFLAILATIGGSLLLVGVSLIIKANWDEIGDWFKITGLVALLTGAYTFGWRWKISPGNHPRIGDACLMLAAVLFLLGIALVSQIYHIDSRPPNGVLLWWAGIAVLPWLTRAPGMQVVSVFAGLLWFILELVADDSWLRLAAVDSGNGEYRMVAIGVLLGLAVLLVGLGLNPGRHAPFAALHEKIGLLLVCGPLYALGFTWSREHWYSHVVHAARWQPVLAVSLLVAAAAAWAWLRNYRELKLLGWFALPMLLPVFAHLLGIELVDSGWLWGGLSCLSLFLLNIGMIRAGLSTGRESWINLGMGFIALNIVTRYFLLFGSMLEGGVFFIVTGLLIIGLGWYLERKRRALVVTARQEAHS